MGFIDDMKKLLWAKKAVAKSAAKKGAKEIQDISSEGYERVKEFTDEVTDKAEDAFDKAKDYVTSKTESSSWDKPEDDFVPSGADSETVTPISETMRKAAKTGGEKFAQAKKAGGEAFEQAKKTGGEALDKAVDMSDKVWEKVEEVGEKVAEADIPGKAKDLVDKVTDKVNTTMDEMLKKAEDLDKTIDDERKAMDADGDGYADIPTHQKLRDQGSLLDDKDDFWSKAASYADGDYAMGKARVVGTDDSIEDTDDGNLKGFEDRDGDGDPLMDDAIIVEDTDDAAGSDEGDDVLNLLPLGDDESE
ncbi:MAG: hypothetical protein DRI69_04655 [Bacteroidetes bacterium]|nr:MAG: hypothetical protein DRI69_04655 [Bacteroidota bacterium]